MRPTISIILTSYKEPILIKKALKALLDDVIHYIKYDFELITVIADLETEMSVSEFIHKKYKKIKWISLKDEYKGKPTALNMAFKEARGRFLLLTDGDVKIGVNSVSKLMNVFQYKKIGGVTGRVKSNDNKNTFWGYISHLLTDAFHKKRLEKMYLIPKGDKIKNLKTNTFYLLSGYLTIIRKIDFQIPPNCLIDDAYISYKLRKLGYILAYEPSAKVYVGYPKNLKDWIKQKIRSIRGNYQLNSYEVVKNKSGRNFKDEIKYILFPFTYANNIKELIYSKILILLRLYIWIIVFFEQKILHKNYVNPWSRIESSK